MATKEGENHNIYTQLRKAQLALKAPKDQKGRFGAHRNAEGILKAVKPLNSKYGITLVIDAHVLEVGGRIYQVATARVTTDGEDWIEAEGWAWEGDMTRGLDAPQVSGAATSYARKYALGGLYDIDDSSDDPDRHHDDPAPAARQARPAPQAPKASSDSTGFISEAQAKLLYARTRDQMAKERGVEPTEVSDRQEVLDEFIARTGVAINEVKKAEMDDVLEVIAAGPKGAA